MAECKDCIHFEICCEDWAFNSEGKTSAEQYKAIMAGKQPCRFFKNKADVVEVVRCKDCIHWGGVTFGYICRRLSGTTLRNETRESDFCSYGEKMDGKGDTQ